MNSRVLSLASAIALLLAPVAGQDPPDQPAAPNTKAKGPLPGPARAQAKVRFFDGVVGTIGTSVILDSEVRRELAPKIASARDKGERLTRGDVLRFRKDILWSIANNYLLAEGAQSSLKGTSREQLDRAFDAYIREYEKDQIAQHGGVQRWTETLSVLQKSHESMVDEERRRFMKDVAWRQNLSRRVRDQMALLVRPQDMLAYYRENRSAYERTGSADVSVLTVSLGSDTAGAARRAQALAEDWRTGKPAAELEKAYGAIAIAPFMTVRDRPDDPRIEMIKTFAGTAAPGTVAPPQARGNALWVLRLERRNEEQTREFSDPAVQREILYRLLDERLAVMHGRLILRTRRDFHYEIPELTGYRPR